MQLVAGAGSGKTTTLVGAVRAAITANIAADRIAVLTFSRRAANELKERLLHNSIALAFCGTIHAFAWRLVREKYSHVRLLKDAAKQKIYCARRLFPALSHIPDSVLLARDFLNENEREMLKNQYATSLRQQKLVDFDSMIFQATQERLGAGRFDAVFVDEFQDTSPDQVRFVQSLKAKKLFAVGDDWQSIYGFRGADISLTREFLTHFANSHRAYLVQNYRSAKAIVQLGNRLIRQAQTFTPKTLRAQRKAMYKPTLFFSGRGFPFLEIWQKTLATIRRRFSFLNKESLTVLVRTNSIRLKLESHKPPGIEILTIHKSKGLEFNNVLVFGIAEGILPHADNNFDEEVRLLYVATTRARNFIGYVGWENADGSKRSAFLKPLMQRCKLVYI